MKEAVIPLLEAAIREFRGAGLTNKDGRLERAEMLLIRLIRVRRGFLCYSSSSSSPPPPPPPEIRFEGVSMLFLFLSGYEAM